VHKALKSGTLDVAAGAAEKLIEDSCRREAVKQLQADEDAGNPRAGRA
jgi:hypothetical protein